ncbi:hypothetical protein I5Q34_27405 [Streptomyces sp. AV19]|uniref:hypothetical protein n=1 Tax=Streptomyces sp. AV19 TaxID=2793068 RepID=UPI0018FE6417|nr:hypothetical protein [Streptomyces sp. AV19]MBH1937952.1 hypothetical protein [Streptomyces sp. AV19]MDG4536891.1 hypothetical protein [Streptomyces sp. AV19]
MTAPRHALRVIKKSAHIALRRSPVLKVGAAVRNSVRAGVATGRDILVDSALMPAAHGSAARVRYAAVLDGHTLNLHAELPADTPVDTPARVVLTRGATELRAEARAHRDDAGRPCVSATLLLGDEISGLPLGTGRWTLALELDASPAAVRLRLLGDGAPGLSGPTRARAACPYTGQRHHLGLAISGRLRLTVAPAPSRAEVLRIERSFTGAGLLFAIHGPAAAGTRGSLPVVEMVEPRHRRVLRRTAEPLPGDDDAWRVTVPLAEMVDASSQVWKFRLPGQAGRGKPLDLGRRDHDLRAPRKVLTPAAFTVRAADGAFVQVRPQYTRRGALQLVCTPRTSVTP